MKNINPAAEVRALKLIEAEEKAGMWLHRGNVATERGQYDKAERHYERAQKWQDQMNELLGNGSSEGEKESEKY